ncbi:cytochrome P450 [Sinorhizobium meliloti]|uniref:cytochrome P450 n=1 Tax=Rhizobium meliloti TaxID=382 RepID=UPI0039892B3B
MRKSGHRCTLLIAGLDTVAAALGFDLTNLARDLEDQESLRREPTRIATAVGELLRAYSTVQIIRVATKDVDFEGVSMRKGDLVSCPTMIANRDPAEFMCPDTIDLARQDHRYIHSAMVLIFASGQILPGVKLP